MKKSTQYKITALLGLGAILLTYNQCVMNDKSTPSKLKYKQSQTGNASTTGDSSNNPTYDTKSQVSIDAFSSSVYKITSMRCNSCHSSSQTPLHASSNIQTAHDAVLGSYKVDFSNPENSRMVLKLKNDKHNCWGDCTSNANDMLNAIYAWKSKIAYSGPTTTPPKNVTEESDSIKRIIDPSEMAGIGTVTLMGESASLKTPMAAQNEAGINFIQVPKGMGGGNKTAIDPNGGSAIYSFRVSQTDYYKVFLLVNAIDTNSDSIFVRANGLDYKDFTIGRTNGYEWKEVKHTTNQTETFFSLTGNSNQTLELKQKEEGVKISKIIITNDPAFDPLTNSKATLRGTVTLALNHLIADNSAVIKFDIEEYDSYSYKISNLRFSGSKSVRFKGIKILQNGTQNPQHATFNNLDKTVSGQNTTLSTNSMIMLKDKGIDVDKISVSFDLIELAL